MQIVIAAGGTGGHIFPALAIAEALRDTPKVQITFIGVGKDLEKKILSDAGFALEVIPFVPLTGKGVLGLLRVIFHFPGALVKALRLYRRIRPAVVIGCGGFPSAVPVLAAAICNIPVVLQEQNVQVGLANKFLSLFAAHVFAVPDAEGFWGKRIRKHFALTVTSNPVRKKLTEVPNWTPPQAGNPFHLLVLGGSQGATRLNSALLAQIEFLKNNGVLLIHQTGGLDFEHVRSEYEKQGYSTVEVFPFIADICREYSRAQLVISRAGAMTVAELQSCGRPAIFVPLEIAKAHQHYNVRHLAANGDAVVIRQDEHLAENLQNCLQQLLHDEKRLAQMAKNMRASSGSGNLSSAEMIAQAVLELGKHRR